MSDEHNENGETREMPLDELMLSESGAGALPPAEEEDAEFAVGPKQLILGDYVLLRRIGAGANGRVFKARHRQMERLVALKMMAPATMRNPAAVRRFRREMKAAAMLFHPNIVTAFDAGEFEGVHYLVMEYVEGQSLTMLVEQHGPLTVEKAVEYTKHAAKGLEYAHSRDVVHRDIKPSNLILDSNGVVKILDLGTARFDSESGPNDLTQTGTIMGTVNYMAPEQARDATEVDHRSDIYSLGCTLHYLLTGSHMFDGNMVQVLMAHAEQPPPSLRKVRPEIPRWLEDVFYRMVAKRRDDRQADMQSVFQDLVEGEAGSSHGIGRLRVNTAESKRKGHPLGIDFGSAGVVFACVKDGVANPIVHDGAIVVPSCVSLSGMHVTIGRAALARIGDHEHVAWRIKRQLGQALYPEELDNGLYPPEVLAALILSRLSNDAQATLRTQWSDVVAAVPLSFSDLQRRAVEEAGYIAGLDIVDLINEPTAATLTIVSSQKYLKQKLSNAKILCVDLGASKLDAVVYHHHREELKAIGVNGTQTLGGQDWDDALAEAMADQMVADDGNDPRQSVGSFRELTLNCELAKQRLTKKGESMLAFSGDRGRVLLKMTTPRFEQLTDHLTKRMLREIGVALTQAELEWSDLGLVLLSGQGTRAPTIFNALRKRAGKDTPIHQLGPEAVAQGAALHAEYQRIRRSGRQPPIQVTDSIANSLGLVGIESRTQRRRNAVLIPKGTPLPAATRKTFKTFREGQDSLMIQMVQGEHTEADKCISVGKCIINDLPPDLPLGTPFDVEFQCAPNGRVVVYVESPAIDFRVTRELQRDHGLTNQQLSRWREWVETMALCSIE